MVAKIKHYSLGLIGYPLAHSLSPGIHLAALRCMGLAGEYRCFEIQPDSESAARLDGLLERMKTGILDGLNVTIPFKQRILNYLDELTPIAAAARAVNTILCRDGRLVGDNTDSAGFLADLQRFLPDDNLGVRTALILGAGGAARAVVLALLTSGWQLVLACRNADQGDALAGDLLPRLIASGSLKVVPLPFPPGLLKDYSFSLLINATSAGMAPQDRTNPWPKGASLPADALVYDLVYNPPMTEFIRIARAAGLQAVSGLGMLVEQAALSFELWTGQSPPRPVLYQEAQHQLSILASHQSQVHPMGG
ncbi:MAG TPA: shikimate dehydrogenase [Anaerolineales bacterium]|nr:shikimate dehydrogenase [Anaerolineales bacterium]